MLKTKFSKASEAELSALGLEDLSLHKTNCSSEYQIKLYNKHFQL